MIADITCFNQILKETHPSFNQILKEAQAFFSQDFKVTNKFLSSFSLSFIKYFIHNKVKTHNNKELNSIHKKKENYIYIDRLSERG
jgi:16S rRNA C1402 (ribose-2'-O) methylase RsmI